MAATPTPSTARATSHLHIDAQALFTAANTPGGIDADAIRAAAPRLDALFSRLPAWKQADDSFLSLPYAAGTESIRRTGKDIAARFSQTVVFGIGGSSLGGEMLVEILGERNDEHPVRFYDNIDPASLDELLRIDWATTCLLVVSKSGTTAETLSQFLTLLPVLEKQLGPEGVRQHVKVITENPRGALHRIADRLRLEVFRHPPVGGRFSVLSIVGLLPAAIAGIDLDALLAGARAMAERCLTRDVESNPAAWNGIAQYLHGERGRTLCVQMAYCDRLRPVVRWYRQLWAESLGKQDADGRARGLTPVMAHGATDQHSQLQLYLAGPDDKQFTFLASPRMVSNGIRMENRFPDIPEAAVLAGHTLGELLSAEFDATRTTLTRRGRPHRTLSLLPDDACALGELIVLMEMETVIVAELLGVDPFDQPAVEEGKVLAREYLGRFKP